MSKVLLKYKTYFYSAFTLIVIISLFFVFKNEFEPTEDKHISMVVLPFVDFSGNSDQDWFTDGLTDALITSLSKIHDFKVISRGTSMRYKKGNKTPPEIAQELNVQYVLAGSILRDGSRLRINTQLIDAANDEHLWAESFDREFKDVLSLLNDAALSIARIVKKELSINEQKQFESPQIVDQKAYELYLKANYYLNMGKLEEIEIAKDYYLKAIDIDSTYALSYVGLGHCYGLNAYYNFIPKAEGNEKLEKVIKKIFELDPDLPEAYYLLGATKNWAYWDWQGAKEAFEHAIKLNPSMKHIQYLWFLVIMGDFKEVLSEAEDILKYDPLALTTRDAVSLAYYFAREYQKSIEICNRSVILEPDYRNTYWILAENYEQLNKTDDVYKNRRKYLELMGESHKELAIYDSLFKEMGMKGYFKWRLQRKEKEEDWFNKNPMRTALIYAKLNDKEKALSWLEKAYEDKDRPLPKIRTNPKWDMLRNEKRFQKILQNMNLNIN